MSTGLLHNFRIDPADLPSEAVIFGRTAAMRDLHHKIDRILNSDLPVLLRGESGTGKEVIARYLHTHSNRRNAPFVKVSCAAIPMGLFESELPGRGKGDFGAEGDDSQTLAEMADGGTVFLDEIADMEWSQQTRLLNLLQDGGQCSGIEGSNGRQARVRVICATNADLEAAVERRTFRQDLFYRIDVIGLNLTPLRERKEDIPELCEYFAQKLARKFGKRETRLSPDALHSLKQWNWPGNMRELENWMARSVALGEDGAVGADQGRHMALLYEMDAVQPAAGDLKEVARQAASDAAQEVILKALQANHWNRRRTAEELNMSYRSLLYKLRELSGPSKRRSKKESPPLV